MTTSCTLFWRCMAMVIPVYLLKTILYTLVSILSPLFSYYPTYSRNEGYDLVEIKWWPEFQGKKIWPITVLAIVAILGLFVLAILGTYHTISQAFQEHPKGFLIGGGAFLAFVLLVALVSFFIQSDAWKMFVEHFEDWKAKRCRIIVVKKRA